ncbi:MAG: hypothetical protein DRJ69_03580 [Thermoprotei archaeon]|nr:MAG: hypothetical protein DRJ69_03580 [Thermoprotei archaeon]
MALVASLAASAIILRGRLEPTLALTVASLLLVASTGQVRQWLKTLRGLALLAALILAVNWVTVGPVFAASMVLLLLLLVASFSSFFLTTSPDDLSLALVKLKLPYELALELSMAIRFVPTLAREAQLIVDAQRARGLDLETGVVKRIKNTVPILVPLVVSAVRRSYRVAEAMESRCFGASKTRTWLFDLRMRRADYAALMASTGLLVYSILLACL